MPQQPKIGKRHDKRIERDESWIKKVEKGSNNNIAFTKIVPLLNASFVIDRVQGNSDMCWWFIWNKMRK